MCCKSVASLFQLVCYWCNVLQLCLSCFRASVSCVSQFRVESMMLRLAKPMNFITCSPSPQQRSRMRPPECIPLTLEPRSMFYSHPVVVLDFQSLYPSVMIAYNYCFSTCLGRMEHLAHARLVSSCCYVHTSGFHQPVLWIAKKSAYLLWSKATSCTHTACVLVNIFIVLKGIVLYGKLTSELLSIFCHMRSHSVTCDTFLCRWVYPILTPARQAGTRFTYPGGMEGWVDLIATQLGVKPVASRL